MATRITNDHVHNLQQIETITAAEGTTSRMLTITGQFDVTLNAIEVTGGAAVTRENETFTLLLGPVLPGQQFQRAIASAWFTKMTLSTGDGANISWAITEVEAEQDDESGQVEMRIEVQLAATRANVGVGAIGFQVTILAVVPS